MEAFLSSLMQHWPGVLFRQRPDLSFELASPRLVEFTGHPLDKWQQQPGLFWEVLHELDKPAKPLKFVFNVLVHIETV